MKKTTKRRPAKKAPTKATKAIEEALGAFKKPEPSIDTRFEQFQKLAEINGELNDDSRRALAEARINQKALVTKEGRKLYEDDILEAQEAFNKAKKLRPDLNFPPPNLIPQPEEWIEYGPLGGQDEDAIAREVLGMDYGVPEEPVVAQGVPSEPLKMVSAQVVPEPPVSALQATEKPFKEKINEKLSEIHNLNLQIEREVHRIELEKSSPKFFLNQIEKCILSLIDALNFLHREGHLRKLPEKDILILKQRIKKGRQLIEKL